MTYRYLFLFRNSKFGSIFIYLDDYCNVQLTSDVGSDVTKFQTIKIYIGSTTDYLKFLEQFGTYENIKEIRYIQVL